jgi:hypothetical protein
MHPVEQRLFYGQATAVDAQWLSFIDTMLAPVSLADLTEHGLSYEDARRLVSVLAMATRVNAEVDHG